MAIPIRLLRIMNLGLFFLLASQPVQADSPSSNRHVLIIHSYHSGLSWTDNLTNGIRDSFTRGVYDIELSAEYLDARRVVDPAGMSRVQSFVISKVKRMAPNLVIVSDNAALNFVLKERARLFPKVPIVFCGINDFHPSMISKYRDITGVPEEASVVETVQLALRLHPKTRKIVVIGRTTVAADKYNRDSFVAALPALPSAIQVAFWDDLPVLELKARIEKVGDDVVIFLNGLIQDEAGRQLMYGETTKWISHHSPVPVYSLWDVYLGYGIVGGKLISAYRQGQLAGELALRILNGESAGHIPVINASDANRYFFDYQQLMRFGISAAELPRESLIINRPDSFYEEHKRIVWMTAGVISLLIGFVVLLSMTIMRRRKAEERLRQANLVVENSPAVLFRWKAAEGWPVELVSKNVTQFGYNPEELLSGKIPFASIVLPEDLERVATEVQEHAASGVDQFQQEYRIVAKDGTIRWIDDHTVIERNVDGKITHFQGVAMDITERKQAEEALNKRLVALLKPLDTADISLDDLFNVDDLQKIQDAFAEATNVGSLITKPDGTPITRPSNFRRLCADIIRKTKTGCANCFHSASVIGRHNPHGPIIQQCLSGGLWDAGASITLGGKHIANWIIGQVKSEAIDEENVIRYAGEIGADETEFRAALREVPVMSKEQFGKIAKALFLVANELSLRAYQNVQQARFIAERKRAEEALRDKTGELDRIFNLSLDLLCIAEMSGKFVRLNPAWEQTLGYSLDDLEGKMFMDFVHPEDVSATQQAVGDLAAGKSVIDFTNRYRCQDGTYRWIEWRSKPYLNTLIYAAARDITERKRTEDTLRETEFFLNKSQQVAHIGSYKFEASTGTWICSPSLYEIFGIGPDYPKNIEGWLDLVAPEDREALRNHLLQHVLAECNRFDREYRIIRPNDGAKRWVYGLGELEFDAKGKPLRMIGTIRDITDRKQASEEQAKLKEQLFQSQKMETVGLLAGGVAHDFNNLLTPILGYSEMLMWNLPAEDPNRLKLQQIKESAERAKELTKRLLAFSRKQMLELKMHDLGDIIRGFEHVLHRTIRENIHIEIIIAPSLGLVHADRGQIEQVLMNLSINAQDAMPVGGVLTIEAKNVDLDESYAAGHPEVVSGSYVMLAVSDTGSGMDEQTQKYIFDPFFTTKELGKGTGLGLSTVYGIVKQHGGSIYVYSETNRGSVFKVYLPKVEKKGEDIGEPSIHENAIVHGVETVLVIEDNEMVRTLAQKMLEELGYQVIVAKDIDHCIEIAKQHFGTINLLLTDVIMPKLNGQELYELLKRDRSDLKVLFMSGYSKNVIGHHGVLDEGINFLQKPFTLSALSQKVREVLDS